MKNKMKYRKNYISLLISFIFKTQVAMYVPQTNLLFLHKIVNKCHKVQLKLNNSSKIKIHFYTWMHELKDVSEFSPILFFRMVWFLTIYSFKNKIKKTLQVSDIFFFLTSTCLCRKMVISVLALPLTYHDTLSITCPVD